MIKLNSTKKIIILSFLLAITANRSDIYSENREGLLPTVTINEETVYVEVADTEETRKKGLMWRNSLDKNTGMLFCYPDNAIRYFWMKNTFIALDMAFIDSNRVIRTIHSTKTVNDSVRLYSSYVPVKYVLEVNQGWLERHDIGTGDTVTFENIVPQNAR